MSGVESFLLRTIGKAVEAPCLATTPGAGVGVALHCALGNDGAGRGVIVNQMERRPCAKAVTNGHREW
jgi:hypothetical protein